MTHRIAVIPGDGIGKEVVPEGIRVLEQLRPFEAIYLGAVGYPGVPDHVSLWGLLIPVRRTFRQYVNLRPVRLLRGVRTPLAGRMPKEIDLVVVRENNEGEYSEIGGRLYAGTEEELVVQKEFPSMFEPVHGSAPDIAGRGVANPIGQIWSGALMLEHLGYPEVARAVVGAIETVVSEGKVLPPDLGGLATTTEVGKAVAALI